MTSSITFMDLKMHLLECHQRYIRVCELADIAKYFSKRAHTIFMHPQQYDEHINVHSSLLYVLVICQVALLRHIYIFICSFVYQVFPHDEELLNQPIENFLGLHLLFGDDCLPGHNWRHIGGHSRPSHQCDRGGGSSHRERGGRSTTTTGGPASTTFTTTEWVSSDDDDFMLNPQRTPHHCEFYDDEANDQDPNIDYFPYTLAPHRPKSPEYDYHWMNWEIRHRQLQGPFHP